MQLQDNNIKLFSFSLQLNVLWRSAVNVLDQQIDISVCLYWCED